MLSQTWGILGEIGFVGWVGCTVGFIFRAFGDDDSFYARKAVFWGSLVVLFYALWVFGMLKA